MAKSSTLPHDSAPRVTSPVANEGKILKLKERVKVLEDREGVAAIRSGDDAPIKERSMYEREAATERIIDDTEEMAMVLTSMDTATVLAGRINDVPTGSGSIPTAGPPAADIPTGSDVVPTASLVFATAIVVTPYSRRKGKEVMVESDTLKNRDYKSRLMPKLLENWKSNKREGEEAKRYKRKGIRSDQESLKKLKSSEEVVKEAKSTAEIPEEKINEMMQLIPIEEVYVEALQVKHPIIDWKVHIEGQRSYWKIIRLGGSSACYQFFVDLLKHLDRDDLNQLWDLVIEYLSIRPASSDKEMELWVELKRLYEPDPEDQLDCQRQRDLHASREGLSSEEGSSPCNDLLQSSSGELFADGK
nr:hypothetical protein [Tanacetum cinerariifolium]